MASTAPDILLKGMAMHSAGTPGAITSFWPTVESVRRTAIRVRSG